MLGIPDLGAQEVAPDFKFKDVTLPASVKIPQRTLRELGLSAKYAIDPKLWPIVEETGILEKLSAAQFPFQEAIAGDEYTVEQLRLATPAFRENFPSDVALFAALLWPKNSFWG